MEPTYEKVSETDVKVIIPQEPEEKIVSVLEIKKEIENHNKDIVFHQKEINKLEIMLSELKKLGVV